jgi:hypothetical protein
MQRPPRLIFKTAGFYQAFTKLATRNGLELMDEVRKGDRSPLAFQEVRANIDRTVHVQYIEDGLARLSYLQIAGPRSGPYLKLFKDKFSFFSEDEMFSSWDGATSVDNKIDAIVRLGVASYDQPPEPYMSRIGQALDDGDPAVRDAGLVAFSYNPWAPMRPQIERLRDHDPDAGVQQRARLLLDAWQDQASGPT